MSATTPERQTLEHLAREKPLASPLVTSIALMDFEHAPPAHVREIYGAVRRAMDDEYPNAPRNLCRIEPRDHAKSEAGSVVIPTWAALRDPNVRVLIMMKTEDLAADKLQECREYIERHGPRFGRRIEKNNATSLKLEREETHDSPTIMAAGFKTGVTGKHFDLVVFDDLVDWEMQRTEGRREKAWSKFQDYSQNLPTEGGVKLVLGTRKHREDLYSHLIHGIGWDTRVEQAVDDWSVIENGEYTVTTRHQNTGAEQTYEASAVDQIDGRVETVVDVDVQRDVGVLWPEARPVESLIDDMITGFGRERSTLVWQRENQNDPSVMEGEVLSESMLAYASELPDSGLTYYAGIDLGVEDDPEAAAEGDTDYWAVAVLAHHRSSNTTYLVDVERKRGMQLKEGIDWVQRVLNRQPADVANVLAEDNQAQTWFTQTARDRGLRVTGSTSSGSKEERIIDMSSRFETGRVQLLEGAQADGWESFIAEWCQFPSGAHDDRLDAVEIALRNVQGGDGPTRVGNMRDLL